MYKTARGQKLTKTASWNKLPRVLHVTHRPQPQSPFPSPLFPSSPSHPHINQSYCKLNIKPIILCIWVLVLAHRTGWAAGPQ